MTLLKEATAVLSGIANEGREMGAKVDALEIALKRLSSLPPYRLWSDGSSFCTFILTAGTWMDWKGLKAWEDRVRQIAKNAHSSLESFGIIGGNVDDFIPGFASKQVYQVKADFRLD